MDKTKAKRVLKVYGKPTFINKKTGKVAFTFARQNIENIKEIEKMSSKELIESWKGLVWTNQIYGCVSLGDMQRINLIELEMDTRKDINNKKLSVWYEESKTKQKKVESIEIKKWEKEKKSKEVRK